MRTQKTHKKILSLLLCCALLAALSGCGRQAQNTIVVIDEQAAIDSYMGAEAYSPQDAASYDVDIVPAQASGAEKQQAAQAARQAAYDSDDYAGSPQNNDASMLHGDVTLGVIAGADAEIHPLRCTYVDLMNVNDLVFESLVALNENRQPVPLLADRWSLNEESGVWTFTLRSGVRFHDGSMLTAEDVVESAREVKRNPATYWYALMNQLVDDIAATDELTVKVKSKSRGYMLLYAMTFPVVQRGSINNALPYGTGPYWYIRYTTGTALRIETNPLWWKRGSDEVKSIVARFCGNTQVAFSALETGDIDMLASEYPTASINRNINDRMAVDYSTNTYECIVPNLRGDILSDIAVRQALMYAIDRTTLATTVYTGMVQESEVPVVPGTWLYNAQATRYNYSPERALQILYNDGWSDRDGDGILEKEVAGTLRQLSLRLVSYDRGTTSTRTEAVEAIAQQLRKVGFNITTSIGTAREVYDAMNGGKFDLALCAFELSDIPNLNFLLGSEGNSNYERYRSDEMDGLLRLAYNAPSAEELQSALYNVQLTLVEDLPILGLFFRTGVLISKQSLGGLSGLRRGAALRGLSTATLQ